MSIKIHTPEEIEHMRVAGRFAAELLDYIAPFVVPGVTTNELVTVESTATQVRAGSLTKTSKNYDVRVRAKNSSGEFGPWSATVRMKS